MRFVPTRKLSLFIPLVLFTVFATALIQLNAQTIIYTVEDGDSLSSIAKKFQTSNLAIMRLNRWENEAEANAQMQVGESLLIPEVRVQLASINTGLASGSEQDKRPALFSSPEPKNAPSSAASSQKSASSSQNQETSPAKPAQEELRLAQARPLVQGQRSTDWETYTVSPGDTLSGIAQRAAISIEELMSANQLSSDLIKVGQSLRLPIKVESKPNLQVDPESVSSLSYTVERGDTLYAISRKFKLSVAELRQLNQLQSDILKPGQILRTSRSAQQNARSAADSPLAKPQSEGSNTPESKPLQEYIVKAGDTLSRVSRISGSPISEIQRQNNLNSDLLKIGQVLMLPQALPETTQAEDPSSLEPTIDPPGAVKQAEPSSDSQHAIIYNIEDGDTLWSVAQKYHISVEQLLAWNPAAKNSLRSGSTLSIYSSSEPAAAPDTESVPAPAATVNLPPASVPRNPASSDRPRDLAAYFTKHAPRVPRQPSANYFEEFTNDPLRNYQDAKKLLQTFDEKLLSMPQKSKILEGYSILIDPGHGGLDPGFNSQSKDGDGNTLYIIEDEYNYDYALRLYRELRLNGANVSLTILSPNHLIIDTPDSSRTLVGQKNEVYNSPFINQRGSFSWPIGTSAGLQKRVEVAESFFNGTPKDKRIFISLHNDNSPSDTDGRLVLFYRDELNRDSKGEEMAKAMAPLLGRGAHYRGQSLAVLRNNPAEYAVLVEMRNIAYPRNSWAIRNADLREDDIQVLAKAVISFVKGLTN